MLRFSDRLARAIRAKRSVLVAGVDPHWELLPAELRGGARTPAARARAMLKFSAAVIDRAAPHAAAVKLQIAFFETAGRAGFDAFFKAAARARRRGLIVIGDAKRADIGSTSAAYAEAFLSRSSPVDALTVNPYFGADGVLPFRDLAVKNGKGIFVLVRTTNPGAAAIQLLSTPDGAVCEVVARLVREWGASCVGKAGFSDVGAVVAANRPAEAARLRKLMPRTFFLVPGYGTQGGTVETVRACFHGDGRGAIVAVSRSLNFAFRQSPWREQFGETRWAAAVGASAKALREELNRI
ncbi:MAG: orotidine-5'-phosphate decarboxylase [Planctomycetota bacterium]